MQGRLFELITSLAGGSSTVVEHLPHHLAAAELKMAKYV